MEGEGQAPQRRRIVLPEDDERLLAECRVDTFRSGGPGGQHQNTTDSGVRMTHLPSGLVAMSRQHRSQQLNRSACLARIRELAERHNRRKRPRIATRMSKAAKQRRVEAKQRRSEKKQMRRKPRWDD